MSVVKGDSFLQLVTAEATDWRVITGYYAKPTNYTSIGVSVMSVTQYISCTGYAWCTQ